MRLLFLITAVSPVTALALQAERVPLTFEKPGEREFVVDKANMLTAAEEQELRGIADSLLTDTSRPLLVVTIESMAAHGGSGLTIELFARYLFGQLGLGRAEGVDGNRGILLLVSSRDRKTRIELGADWPVSADRKTQEIVQRAMIPRFKRQDFGGGILAGTKALAALARSPDSSRAENSVPSDTAQPGYPAVNPHFVKHSDRSSGGLAGFCCLGLFVVLLLPLLGRGGWIFSIVSLILFSMASNVTTKSKDDDDENDGGWWTGTGSGFGSGSFGGGFSSGGGGFSGGSFGGGFSSGGGASGSW